MKSDPIANIIIFLCLVFCTAVMAAYPPKIADDATLYQAIQTKLTADPVLMGERIGVEPHRGTVKLSGIVDSRQQAYTAINVAKATPGVRNLDASELMVEEQAAGK